MTAAYLNAAQVAELLGVSRSQAYEVIHRCVHVRIGRSVRVTRKELERYLRRCEVKPWDPAYTSEAALTGQRFTDRTDSESESAPDAETSAPRSDEPASSKGRRRIRKVFPRAPRLRTPARDS